MFDFFFPTELHEFLIYTWIWSPYQICDLQIFFFSFHRLSFHFMDGFFYYAKGFEFDMVSLVYFCSSSLGFWWLSCLSCLYFGKQSFISCFICYYLLLLLLKDTDWLNEYKNKTHIYAVYKRPTSVLETHTDWKWEDGKRYSMQVEIKRKPDRQFSYQKKDLKIKTIRRTIRRTIIKKDTKKWLRDQSRKDIAILNVYVPTIEHLNT